MASEKAKKNLLENGIIDKLGGIDSSTDLLENLPKFKAGRATPNANKPFQVHFLVFVVVDFDSLDNRIQKLNQNHSKIANVIRAHPVFQPKEYLKYKVAIDGEFHR